VKPTKVVIGLPSGAEVNTDFALSLLAMVIQTTRTMTDEIHIAAVNKKGSLVPVQRAQIVGAAAKMNADKLLFLDTDMVFPTDTILRLLAAKKDIVGAPYATKEFPARQTARDLEGKDLVLDHMTPDLMKVGRLGTGCLLVDMEVFKTIGEPTFLVPFVDGKYLGEDYYFCEKAKAAGYEIWADVNLGKRICHMGMAAFTCADVGPQKPGGETWDGR
jgi:hypothetical protein